MNRILLAFLLVLLGMGSSTLAQVNPRTPTWTAYNSVPQAYTVTDLGQLAPTAINALGQVVGNYNNEAYIWDKWRGMRGLGLLPGGTFSWAAAINDSGVVTGTADGNGTVLPGNIFTSDPEQECSDLTQPFIWRQKMLG